MSLHFTFCPIPEVSPLCFPPPPIYHRWISHNPFMSPLIVSDRIQCSNCHSPEHFSIRWDFASQQLSSVWLKETHHNSLQVRMSLLLTPWVRRVKIRNTDNTKSWWGYRTTGTRIHCWGEWKWFNHVGRQFCGLLIKLTTFLPHNLAIVLFSIYPPKLQNYIYTKPCTWMFTAAYSQLPKLEAAKMSFGRGMDERTVVHPDNAILFSAKNKSAIRP